MISYLLFEHWPDLLTSRQHRDKGGHIRHGPLTHIIGTVLVDPWQEFGVLVPAQRQIPRRADHHGGHEDTLVYAVVEAVNFISFLHNSDILLV